MKWLALLSLVLAGLALPLGCSTETSNKNTNWLMACASDTDCGAASCVCGICTVTCAAPGDACAANSSVCAASFAATTQCSGQPNSGICLAPCAQESDCEGSRTCVAGACVSRWHESCPAHPSALACSGFDVSAQPGWTPSLDSGAELSVVSAPRLAGSGALLARTTSENARSRFSQEFPKLGSGQLYLRAWLYSAPGSLLNNVHSLVVGDANTADYGSKFVYAGGKLHVAAAGAALAGSTDAPLGQWYCLRLELGIGDQGSVRAYLNDTLFVDATGVDTLPAAGVHNVTAGIDFAGQAEPAEVFLDELVLDTSPVACWD